MKTHRDAQNTLHESYPIIYIILYILKVRARENEVGNMRRRFYIGPIGHEFVDHG